MEKKKATEKAADAANRLSESKSTINQIRAEYGLKPIKDKLADKLFTKE